MAAGGVGGLVELTAVVFSFPLHHIFGSLLLFGGLLWRGGLRVRLALAAYSLWTWLDGSPQHGGFAWAWRSGVTHLLRRSPLWSLSARYFPVRLRRTVPLAAEGGPYIFVCHPHGIIGIAPMTHFGTYATEFDRLFPGIPIHLLGHSAIFRIPFFREWILLHGHGTVDRACCMRLLSTGHSIALTPGGAKESLECLPGTMRLLARKRRGFVRLALKAGAALVPVVSFGENEAYTTVQPAEGSLGRRAQKVLQARLGFALPLFVGRGLLPLLPRRTEISTVVGAPVRAPHPGRSRGEEPTEDEVNELHSLYCGALQALFDGHKALHGAGGMVLELV